MNAPHLDLLAGRLDGVDAQSIAVRMAQATRLAALPGTIVAVSMVDLRRHAADPVNVGDHSPATGIRRVCPDTGATLLETMDLAPLGPGRGVMSYLLEGSPGMRTLRVDTPLDVFHHGSDRLPSDPDRNPGARWPSTDHAHLRLLAATRAVERLAAELSAGRPAPGDDPSLAISERIRSVARVRIAALRQSGRGIHGHSITCEAATPWTRPDLSLTTYTVVGQRTGERLLAPAPDAAFRAATPSIGTVVRDASTDADGDRADRIAFAPHAVSAHSDEDEVAAMGSLAVMREASSLGLSPKDFAA